MENTADSSLGLAFVPVTPENWADMESLFNSDPICQGCYCMWFRVKRKEFSQMVGRTTREAMKAIVDSGEVPGLLAYSSGEPIGWVSVGPRQSFGVLGRSRILKPVDDQPVWSVVCFFVKPSFRRQGITVALLKEAVAYAGKQGARIIEGYPVDSKNSTLPDPWVYYGLVTAFEKAGFIEIARRSEKRPIMRCVL
jgi:GNAT superfamily N-acetyltransferase